MIDYFFHQIVLFYQIVYYQSYWLIFFSENCIFLPKIFTANHIDYFFPQNCIISPIVLNNQITFHSSILITLYRKENKYVFIQLSWECVQHIFIQMKITANLALELHDTREEPDSKEAIARGIAFNTQILIASPGSASAIVGHDSVKVPKYLIGFYMTPLWKWCSMNVPPAKLMNLKSIKQTQSTY